MRKLAQRLMMEKYKTALPAVTACRCPFVRVGDIITLKSESMPHKERSRQNIIVVALVYTQNVAGACHGLGQYCKMILGSDNKFYHPGNDVEGIDCKMCPYDMSMSISDPPQWAIRYWEDLYDATGGGK